MALGIERCRVDVHAGAGLPKIDDHQADDQSERGHHLEVDQRLQPDPADLLHVLHAGDAVHHGAENDRRDQHLDQLDEEITQRLHLRAERWVEVPEQDAEHDGAQDLRSRGAGTTCGGGATGAPRTVLDGDAMLSLPIAGSRLLRPSRRRERQSAVMFTMRRTVLVGVRMCTGRAAPSRIGPTVMPSPQRS